MRVTFLFGLLFMLAAWAGPAARGQSYLDTKRLRAFPDVVLAPEADWYRPDLAARRVRSVTRTFAGSAQWQPLGDSRNLVLSEYHPNLPGYQLREELSYDAQGRLLRFQFSAKAGELPPRQLLNEFRYDARQRLVAVQVSGTPALTQLTDELTLDMYIVQLAAQDPKNRHWRPSGPLTQRHLLPRQYFNVLASVALRELRFGYDAAGQRCSAEATLELRAQPKQPTDSAGMWLDTVRLDLRRGLRMVVVGSSWGAVDSSWLRPSARWLQLTTPAPSPADTVSALRLHQFLDYYHHDFAPGGDNGFFLTSFFDAAGRLRLTRLPMSGEVCRYDYDARGQPTQLTTYRVELPFQRPPLPYFGSQDDPHYMIVDCGGELRHWLPLPGGQRALLQFVRRQQLRHEAGTAGLPERAVIRTTTASFKADVQFRFQSPVTPGRGHFVRVPDWRHIQAQNRRAEKYLRKGCVPMTTTGADTHEVRFSYELYP